MIFDEIQLHALATGLSNWFPFVALVAVKVTALLAITGLITLALHRASSAARHFVWTLGMLGAFLVPVFSLILPSWRMLPDWVQAPTVESRQPAMEPENASHSETAAVAAQIVSKPFDSSLRARRDETALLNAPHGLNEASQSVAESETRYQSSALVTRPNLPAIEDNTTASFVLQAEQWLGLIWLAGTLLLLLPIVLGQFLLRLLSRRSERSVNGPIARQLAELCFQLNIRRPVTLLRSQGKVTPVTWGLFRAKLLLPSEADSWPKHRIRSVLVHELAHIDRWDCLTQFLAQLAFALFWFNPLVWLAARRMRIEREQACDDRVLATGTSAADYAQHLLDVTSSYRTTRIASVAAVGMARRSQLEGRMISILDRNRARRPFSFPSVVLLIASCFLLVAGLSSIAVHALAEEPQLAEAVEKSAESSVQPAPAKKELPVKREGRWQMVSTALRGHVRTMDWSADGRLIAFGESGNIRIHDAQTLELVQVLMGHNSAIFEIAFSPNNQQVASAGADGTVRIWNINGKSIQVFKGHQNPVNGVAWSGDSTRVASASSDGTVRIWGVDGTTGPVYRDHKAPVRCVTWSPKGNRIASGDDNHAVHLWSLDKLSGEVLEGHRGSVVAIDWSLDGKQIASTSHGLVDFDGGYRTVSTVRLWNEDGSPASLFMENRARFMDVAWSADSQKVAACDDERNIHIWNIDGESDRVISGRAREVTAIAWNPNSSQIAMASRNMVQLINLDGSVGSSLPSKRNYVRSVDWNPDGTQIAAAGGDGNVRLFGSDGSIGWTAKIGSAPIQTVAWSADGKQLVAGSGDRILAIFSADGTPQNILSLEAEMTTPVSACWSPDGEKIAAGCFNGTLHIFNVDGDDHKVLRGHSSNVHSVAWSPDGKWIASGSFDSTVRLWEPDGTPGLVLEGHDGNVDEVTWSPDSKQLASGDTTSVRIWNVDGTPGLVMPTGDVIDLCWSPDGSRIAAGTWEARLHVWNANGKHGPTFFHHAAAIVAVDWGPDSNRLATGSYDSSVKVCDTKTGGLLWTAYMLEDGQSATLDAANKLLHGDLANASGEFQFVVENEAGETEILDYDAFLKHQQKSKE